ncbi:hypothetical protein ABZP36_022099 [Zizania latifolia]
MPTTGTRGGYAQPCRRLDSIGEDKKEIFYVKNGDCRNKLHIFAEILSRVRSSSRRAHGAQFKKTGQSTTKWGVPLYREALTDESQNEETEGPERLMKARGRKERHLWGLKVSAFYHEINRNREKFWAKCGILTSWNEL